MVESDRICPECGKRMVFLECTSKPSVSEHVCFKCKHTEFDRDPPGTQANKKARAAWEIAKKLDSDLAVHTPTRSQVMDAAHEDVYDSPREEVERINARGEDWNDVWEGYENDG